MIYLLDKLRCVARRREPKKTPSWYVLLDLVTGSRGIWTVVARYLDSSYERVVACAYIRLHFCVLPSVYMWAHFIACAFYRVRVVSRVRFIVVELCAEIYKMLSLVSQMVEHGISTVCPSEMKDGIVPFLKSAGCDRASDWIGRDQPG